MKTMIYPEASPEAEQMIQTVSYELAISMHALAATMSDHYREKPLGSNLLALDKNLFGASWGEEPIAHLDQISLQSVNEGVLYSMPTGVEV